MKATQSDKILRHLQEFGSINPLEALSEYGVMRLASRISDLKKVGYPINKKMVKGLNRFGEVVTYAVYTLEV